MITMKCKECGKLFKGKNEYEADADGGSYQASARKG